MSAFFLQYPYYLVPTVAIVCATVVLLVAILCHNWRRARLNELEATLKQDMLNRGLPAADIERVLSASAANPPETPAAPDPVSDNEYYLIEKLVDEGKSADDIERVLRAVRGPSPARPLKANGITLP
jgi:hypothetical protein